LKNRSLVLLSGESTTLPVAEAKALFLAYDPDSRFESPEPRILIAESSADPYCVGSRIAFARRVGPLVDDRSEVTERLAGHRVRFRVFNLCDKEQAREPGEFLDGLNVVVDLRDPEYELTIVRGHEDYVAVTTPGSMNQKWSQRRPRTRPFFHPSAIFPKLSRALVNLSRCREGDVFLDPFSGTGSIPLEAHLVGARVVAVDVAEPMVRGALRNMRHYRQEWLGVIRADSTSIPVSEVDAVATDIPYGRASSTRGRRPAEMTDLLLRQLAAVMNQHSHLVLMHPQDRPVIESQDLSIVEEHHLQVHKRLTRTITVLERR